MRVMEGAHRRNREKRGIVSNKINKLECIIGRPVAAGDAWGVADYLMAVLTHVTNARPLFGVLNLDTDRLEWTAGGAEFHDTLDCSCEPAKFAGPGGIADFAQLLTCFGIVADDIASVREDIGRLSPGAAMTVLKPLIGTGDKYYRLVVRRRRDAHAHEVQFSWMDITPFQDAAQRTREMAAALVRDMQGEDGVRAVLNGVLDDLDRLFGLEDDQGIAALAQDMSARVTLVSERMVQMLLAFEGRYDVGHWQPQVLNPSLRPAIPVHNAPVKNWHELHSEVLRTVDGEPAIIDEIADQMRYALSFVQNAASTLVVSPTKGRIFALNGPAAEREFSSIEDFVRALGVEENSTRTAVDFFAKLEHEPVMGVFALGGENVEAWGRPGMYGGWQAMIMSGAVQGVDVRGLFHGLKNLLLHLQVLYVVNTRADVVQVRDGLSETAEKIQSRLKDLDAVAKTGHRVHRQVEESVAQWLKAAQRVGVELGGPKGGGVEVACDGVDRTVYTSAPSEMEDTFEELVRNAFQHGAKTVRVDAMGKGDHLCMQVTDDGPGMADDKLIQVQRVLKTRAYEADLTTRENGTGNGLLAAANAVSRFVDGQLSVDHGPGGRGVQVSISMKLPA